MSRIIIRGKDIPSISNLTSYFSSKLDLFDEVVAGITKVKVKKYYITYNPFTEIFSINVGVPPVLKEIGYVSCDEIRNHSLKISDEGYDVFCVEYL